MLGLLLRGQTSKQIALALGLSDLTVRKHRENLMRRLGAHSIADLFAVAPHGPDR